MKIEERLKRLWDNSFIGSYKNPIHLGTGKTLSQLEKESKLVTEKIKKEGIDNLFYNILNKKVKK